MQDRFIEERELDAEKRALIASAERTGAPDPRVVRIMVRSSAGVAWVKCWNSVLYEGKLPHKLKEMCRIRISVAHRCGYCSTVRSNVARDEGPMKLWSHQVLARLPQQGYPRVERQRWNTPIFQGRRRPHRLGRGLRQADASTSAMEEIIRARDAVRADGRRRAPGALAQHRVLGRGLRAESGADGKGLNQQIRFCKSADGTRIAYAVTGTGTSLVRAPHWLTHLEYEWQSPIWRPWMQELSRDYRLLRIDGRAVGLSDWDPKGSRLERAVEDSRRPVDAAGFERFALFGASQGGSTSIEYAVRHPRAGHAYCAVRNLRPRLAEGAACRPSGYESSMPSSSWWRQAGAAKIPRIATLFPHLLPERRSSSQLPERAAARFRVCGERRARHAQLLRPRCMRHSARVRLPGHRCAPRDDRRVPFEEGRLLAGLIPGARLLTLETSNHILLENEPAFRQFFDGMRAFVSPERATRNEAIAGLTPRETEVLERIAQGLDNAQIAAHLGLSEKTVRNHITHIFDKIGVENRSQAIVLARQRGLGLQSRPS